MAVRHILEQIVKLGKNSEDNFSLINLAEEAEQVLETYHLRDLWCVNDVLSQKNMSKEKAFEILDKTVTSDYIISSINDMIQDKIHEI